MNTLSLRRCDAPSINELVASGPAQPAVLGDDQRISLASRFRAVASHDHRRLDAWSVETVGVAPRPFRWSPALARRTIGRAALRRWSSMNSAHLVSAARDEVDELLVRAAAGYARPGTVAHWLCSQSPATLSLVVAEATTWASVAVEVLSPLELAWTTTDVDVFYDVATARTTLRSRRDALVSDGDDRVVLRFRSGVPTNFAGAGLRADLVIDALGDPRGRCARRMIGIWPDAGLALGVDGTLDDLRSGARDLVRTAVTQQRRQRVLAA
jgi:hypothetical protein